MKNQTTLKILEAVEAQLRALEKANGEENPSEISLEVLELIMEAKNKCVLARRQHSRDQEK